MPLSLLRDVSCGTQFTGGMWWDKIINAIPWLVCKLWFKVVCPILCFLKGWLMFFILWLKANTIDFVLDLLEQIIALIAAYANFVWMILTLLWQLTVLIFSFFRELFALIRIVVDATRNIEPATINYVGNCWTIMWDCLIEWTFNRMPFKLFIWLGYAEIFVRCIQWAVHKLSYTR